MSQFLDIGPGFILGPDITVTGNITSTGGNISAPFGTVYGFNITTSTSAAQTLTLEDNGIFAGGTTPDVDISFTTQGEGCMVLDGLTGYGLNSTWRTCQAEVQTTDATATVLQSIPLLQEEMIQLQANINGFKSTFDECLGGTVNITAYRPLGGVPTLVGAIIVNINATSGCLITGRVNIVANCIELVVVGIVGQTWNWVTTYSYMYTTH